MIKTMKLTFGAINSLPDKYIPGRIDFIKEEGAIYLAVSETELIQYSGFKDLENLSNSKQDVIEDIETIRESATQGAALAQNFSVVNNEDIDILFEQLN